MPYAETNDPPSLRDTEIVIPARFCGPDRSGNGGWVCGSVAAALVGRLGAAPGDTPVTVTLRVPPPLERPLVLRFAGADGGVDLVDAAVSRPPSGSARRGDAVLVASAKPTGPMAEPTGLPSVTPQQAVAARDGFPGLRHHPYERCYACGTDRAPGDGLRLTPAPIAGADPWWAAAWTPTEVSGPIVWAALDCPTGWAAGAGGRYLLLGRMTARVRELPPVGTACVVLARCTGREGRKAYAESFLCMDGRVVAQAATIWIETQPQA